MFPDAYPDDVDASAEFRRWTEADLVAQKTTNASTVHAWLTGAREGAFEPGDEQAWLRCLTDLRLTIADRLGILVWGEAPGAYAFSPRAVQRLMREWMDAVERDASHPSIVTWVPANESWGVQHIATDP
ncbi:DUF2017 family protein, partial [Bacillus sp. S34]|nr:DUF2017 family protein [Bacillus sp. S34]